MAGSVAVKLAGLTKLYESVAAVVDLSLEIADGEFFALLGPSGCGKTTTLKLIGGFEQPTRGDVLIHGQSMRGLPPFRRNVNTVFQNYALFPHLDVRNNVAFGLKMRGLRRRDRLRAADEALERVHLQGLGRRPIHQLSGGQQQRVALARALVNRPAVLLLDEPLGALDFKLRKAMQAELKSIQRGIGISFIYVTHDQEEALTMADRIAVMSDGRIHQIGSPREVYETPSSRFVAGFIGESSFLSGHVTSRGDGEVLVAVGDGVEVRSSVPVGFVPNGQVTLAVRPERVRLIAIDAQPGGGENAVPATVKTVLYAGSDLHFVLVGPGGVEISARIPASVSDAAALADGGSVRAVFPVESTLLLAGDGGASDQPVERGAA